LQREGENATRAKIPDAVTLDEEKILEDIQLLTKPLDIAMRDLGKDKFVTLSSCIPIIRLLRTVSIYG